MITTSEAADVLAVSPARLRRLAASAGAVHDGWRWMWSPDALDAVRQRRTRTAGVPVKCTCGECLTCYNRTAQRAYRAKRRGYAGA